jgi:putative ABC transport system permease protein
MVMRALDLKLLRDLRRIWAQGLAIALVLACGVAILVLSTGAQLTLSETRDAYYERQRFADVFATATRAPLTLVREIERIDGVAQVETRIASYVVLDMPGMVEPAMGRLISLPEAGPPLINVPLLRMGRLPDPLRADEVAVTEPFAEAHGLLPGDGFQAILDGQLRRLTVTGLMLSPEFIYTMGPGTLIPDDRRFGILWMGHEGAAAAFDMDGAFNEVVLRLTPGASEDAVVAALDTLLEPYGGTGAHGRDDQISHAFLQSELDQLAAMAVVMPPVFLLVAAFLVNMVLGRLINLERQQIGLLKAVGYTTNAVAIHYLKMSAGIGIGGVLIGWGFGAWGASAMAGLYQDFFRFPYLVYVPSPAAFAASGALGIAAVVIGALRAVRRSVRLSPAVAMSPPAPPKYGRGLVDRLAGAVRLRQTTMMILRSIVRWPGRTAVTLFGVAASVAVLVGSLFTFDAMDEMVDDFFYNANRAQMTVMLTEARSRGIVEDARALPGVLDVEGQSSVPVRLSHGPVKRSVRLEGQSGEARLIRVLDTEGRAVQVPPEGIALPDTLARELGLGLGDLVGVELLTQPRETHLLPVTALTRQSMGQDAHMDEAALFQLMRQVPQVNRLNLLVDEAELPALYARLKATPAVSGVMLWDETRTQFQAEIQRNLATSVTIFTILGILITFGVVYNAARIQLAERGHELASLRVLGFGKGEVAYVLVGELMLLAFAAVPLGWIAGYAFAALIASGLSTDFVSIPLVVSRQTFGLATLIVLGAALGSALVVKRRLDRIEIVTALKQKE